MVVVVLAGAPRSLPFVHTDRVRRATSECEVTSQYWFNDKDASDLSELALGLAW